MKRYYFLILALLLVLNVFCLSCSDYVATDLNTTHGIGQTLTPEILESVKNSFTEEDTVTSNYFEKITLDENTVFYWTRNGSKLHFFSNCRYLAKTDPKNIFSGNYSDAHSEKLDEICSACFEKSGLESFDPSGLLTEVTTVITTTEDQESVTSSEPEESTAVEVKEIPSVLYFTVGGSKYHLYRNCRSLSGSDEANVRSGDIVTALESGKKDACSFCLKECGISAEELPWNTQNEETD